jgi:hypothetical protein
MVNLQPLNASKAGSKSNKARKAGIQKTSKAGEGQALLPWEEEERARSSTSGARQIREALQIGGGEGVYGVVATGEAARERRGEDTVTKNQKNGKSKKKLKNHNNNESNKNKLILGGAYGGSQGVDAVGVGVGEGSVGSEGAAAAETKESTDGRLDAAGGGEWGGGEGGHALGGGGEERGASYRDGAARGEDVGGVRGAKIGGGGVLDVSEEEEEEASGALYEAMQEDLRQARLQEEAQCKGLAWASVRERELEALEKKEEEERIHRSKARGGGVLELAGVKARDKDERERQREAEMYSMWPEIAGVCAKDKHPLDYRLSVVICQHTYADVC